MKHLEVFAAIHYGNYTELEDGSSIIVNDNCPCCNWEPSSFDEKDAKTEEMDSRDEVLGHLWHPKHGKGMGGYFQIFKCGNCGVLYATHLN